MQNADQPDIIDALLYTGRLEATDPKDFIYGIIGMAGMQARVMTVQEWVEKRQHEVFIPIDYSADLASILSVVTWVFLMKAGLGIIAKFKAFVIEHTGSQSTYGQSLPSWVIDWRLAASLFTGCGLQTL